MATAIQRGPALARGLMLGEYKARGYCSVAREAT
jgi:hypothetical protein